MFLRHAQVSSVKDDERQLRMEWDVVDGTEWQYLKKTLNGGIY